VLGRQRQRKTKRDVELEIWREEDCSDGEEAEMGEMEEVRAPTPPFPPHPHQWLSWPCPKKGCLWRGTSWVTHRLPLRSGAGGGGVWGKGSCVSSPSCLGPLV
jgi:hypothetical protein